jgi:hypothetical protein
MVLPLVDEDKPKCILCHFGFENIEKLREHQNIEHKDFFETHESIKTHQPSPGDVSIF